MTTVALEFLSKMERDMENTKPISDLERIQQSYSSGSQKYVPLDDQAGTAKPSDAPKAALGDSSIHCGRHSEGLVSLVENMPGTFNLRGYFRTQADGAT